MEEEEEDSEEEWTDEEDEFHSPLEDLNPYVHFSDCLQHLQTSNPQRFQVRLACVFGHGNKPTQLTTLHEELHMPKAINHLGAQAALQASLLQLLLLKITQVSAQATAT